MCRKGADSLKKAVIAMKQVTVVVNSITYAMKGAELLQRAGIRASVGRDMQRYGRFGCGYCIYITAPDPQAAVRLLQNQVKIREIFWEDQQEQ